MLAGSFDFFVSTRSHETVEKGISFLSKAIAAPEASALPAVPKEGRMEKRTLVPGVTYWWEQSPDKDVYPAI